MAAHKRWGAVAVGLTALVAATALGVGGAGAEQQSAFALPRALTLYMSGNQWSPNNDLNPAKNWDYITGLVGFAYETPFRYDPLNDTFKPWLATSGTWTSKTTYSMTIRKNVKWSDGQVLKPSDVKYSFDLAKISTHPQLALWTDTGLKSTKVSGQNVIFTFSGTPGYQQFDFYRFNVAIVPQHIFKSYSQTDITTGNLEKGKIVGTGPYLYQSGVGAQSQTVVWRKNVNWWARKALGLNVAPTYIVDIHNASNAAALANFKAGNIDLFNNFAPKAAITKDVKTYFGKAPYHLGANTTWLFPNTTRKPMNDRTFRRALAYSINMGQIIDKAYQGLVQKASPTGLLPIWNKWVDQRAVDEWGFSYNVNRAKSILAGNGYKDRNGDGFVENKDGSTIDLKIICPNGWSDWMTAIQIIANSAKAVGIKVTPAFPEYATLVDDRGHARVRPAPRQRPAVQQHAVDVLPVHLPAAGQGQPDQHELRAVRQPEGLGHDEGAGQDPVREHQRLQGSDGAAAAGVHAGSARDSALVQRHVGHVQHEVLVELATGRRAAVHARVLAELLADDEHRHAHASEAGGKGLTGSGLRR